MKKTKVLWFSNTPAAGDEYISSNGTGGWMKSLDKAIQDNVDLHVVFCYRGYPAEFRVGKTTYYSVSTNSLVERIKDKISFIMGKRPDVERELKVVEKVHPDIIHIHGTETPWIEILPYIKDIPVILSVQAIMTVMSHKYYSGIQKSDIPYFSIFRKFPKYHKKRVDDERLYTKYVTALLGRTEWDRRVYSVLLPDTKYYVCNEVLRDGFYKALWQDSYCAGGKLIIHTTTGAHLIKGLETICKAVSLLNNLSITIEWRVAGVKEDSEYVNIIKNKLKGDYPTKGLLLLGSLNEEELIKRMLEAHIYVSPSHQDNSPNALCEATLIGMPCISTCAGGSSTIIKDGHTGILIQDGDPWVMAGAILELARNRQLANYYARAAREEAVTRHDKQRIVENLLGIYNNISSQCKK